MYEIIYGGGYDDVYFFFINIHEAVDFLRGGGHFLFGHIPPRCLLFTTKIFNLIVQTHNDDYLVQVLTCKSRYFFCKYTHI
jgi:hypothetical protein